MFRAAIVTDSCFVRPVLVWAQRSPTLNGQIRLRLKGTAA